MNDVTFLLTLLSNSGLDTRIDEGTTTLDEEEVTIVAWPSANSLTMTISPSLIFESPVSMAFKVWYNF